MQERTGSFSRMVNEKWCIWLNSLDLIVRELVMRNELFYFDEYVACRMSPSEILADADTAAFVDQYSYRV